MGNNSTCLDDSQVKELKIDLYSLIDFDLQAYRDYYDYPSNFPSIDSTAKVDYKGISDATREKIEDTLSERYDRQGAR